VSGLRPGRPTALAVVTAAMSLVTLFLARTTGSGWLMVLDSLLLALLAVSALAPGLALARLVPAAVAPADATAGQAVALGVTVRGRASGAKLRLLRPSSAWVRLDAPIEGRVQAVPASRGVLHDVDLEVASAAPFGLVWWRRRWRLPLPRPMEVGPAPRGTSPPPSRAGGAEPRAGRSTAPHGADMVRNLRDYVPGDPLRLVSWPATARHGRPVVKELEAPGLAQLILVVDLRGDPEEAESTASLAAGMAAAALDQGMAVQLLTAEREGPRQGLVRSALEVGRRLARAVAGPPPEPPATTGQEVVMRLGRG
jgi:uncharacterized protein (DUF58 family)